VEIGETRRYKIRNRPARFLRSDGYVDAHDLDDSGFIAESPGVVVFSHH